MNERGQTLLIRFVLLFPLLSLCILGVYRLFLPLVAPETVDQARHLVDAIVPAAAIGLALSAALSFAALSHGSQEQSSDLTPIRLAFGWMLFFALALMAFASFGIPAIHKSLSLDTTAPTAPRPVKPDPPVNTLKEGLKHYYSAKYEAAIDRIQEFTQSMPGHTIAADYLTSARAALARQEQIKSTRAGDQTATFRKGYENLLEGNYLAAIMEFERLLRFQPNHSLAKKHLADARARLKAEQSGTEGDTRTTGLKARLERTVSLGIKRYESGDLVGALSLMSDVLILDGAHPTALRYANLARERISARDFLDEEIAGLPWLPALPNAIGRTPQGEIVTANRLARIGNQLWLQDFWILPPPGVVDGVRIFARYGKTVATNTLVWRNALVITQRTNGALVSTPRSSGKIALTLDPDRAETATLLYGGHAAVTPLAIIEHGTSLIRDGYPPVPLWQTLARQITLPFLVFLLASVAAASGWRFHQTPATRSSFLLKLASVPVLGLISWFCYGALVRLTDSLVFAAEASGIHGWAAIPVAIVLILVSNFLFLSRLLRP